jgi:uncharacterized protein YkwD
MRTLIIKIIATLIVAVASFQGLYTLYRADRARAAELYNNAVATQVVLSNTLLEKPFVSDTPGLWKVLNTSIDDISIYNVQGFSITATTVSLDSGTILKTGASTLAINAHGVEVINGTILYDASQDLFRMMDGEAYIDGAKIIIGEQIKSNKPKETFDRAEYNLPETKDLVEQLKLQSILPGLIADFVAPSIIIDSPTDTATTGENPVTVVGSVEDATQLWINDTATAIGEGGKFGKEIAVQDGANTIVVRASDKWGNTSQKELKLNYDKCIKTDCNPVQYTPTYYSPPGTSGGTSQPPVTTGGGVAATNTTVRADSSVGCENEAYNYQFLQILNAYRVANGLNALTIESSLSLAACDHAKWMQETGTFSHTGIYNSSPVDRCVNRGTYCDAENLALSYPDMSPQKMFDLYKNSPGHNANMLGSHTVVGIAWAGIYNACDFR